MAFHQSYFAIHFRKWILCASFRRGRIWQVIERGWNYVIGMGLFKRGGVGLILFPDFFFRKVIILIFRNSFTVKIMSYVRTSFFFFLQNSIEGSRSKVTKLSSQSDSVTDGNKSKTSSLTFFSLTHFQPMLHFYTPWKHVFREYRSGTLVDNGLM